MDWRRIKTSDVKGLQLVGQLQKAWMDAYQVHVAGGGGLLPQAAIFARKDVEDRSEEFFFTPQTLQLIGAVADVLGATPCEAPLRTKPGQHRFESIALIVGEAGAWELLR